MTSEFRLNISQARPFSLEVALDCAAGELLAIVGPSGCGKSTLLRMIAGLQHAASGEISLNGTTWFSGKTAWSPRQRSIGYVPQHYGLFPHMTALDNVRAALHALPRQEQTSRAGEWLEKVQLASLARRKPSELSGGQQQRVALARALAAQPSILLLDEPFSALDSITREGLYLTLAGLKPQLGIPMILVTHNLAEASLLADRLAVMDNGRILQHGTPAEVLQFPRNRRVAEFMSVRNILTGRVLSSASGQAIITLGEQTLPLPRALPVGSVQRWCLPQTALALQPSQDADSTLRGTVHNLVRLGDEWLVTVALPGTEDMLTLQYPATEPLAIQQSVGIRLQSCHIHILEG